MLFALDANASDVERVIDDFWRESPGDAEGRTYADELVRRVTADRGAADELIRAASTNWRLERMTRVDRCVLRLGGKPLILYRRSYEEMPAIREEIHEAEHEGIEIQFLVAPLEIRKRGRMLSLTTQKMKLGGKDSSGRRC